MSKEISEAIILQIILGLIDRATALGALFMQAQTEGRSLTDAEVQTFADEAGLSIATLRATANAKADEL